MKDESSNIGLLPDIDANTRLLLAAGLRRLSEDLAQGHPLLDEIQRMRALLVEGTLLSKVPSHISVDEPEFRELISFLQHSQYWALYWEHGPNEDYEVVAEVAVEGGINHFVVASGLAGTAAFALEPDDAAFLEELRGYVRMWAPATTDELTVAVVEVPVAQKDVFDVTAEGEVTEAYLSPILEPTGLDGLMTRGAHGCVHSNPTLAAADFAGVWILAIDTKKRIEALPTAIASYESALVSSLGRQHS